MAPVNKTQEPPELMVVNDQPGEECRIAILRDSHLEELYTERTGATTSVGNIYKGRVTKVEPAIQAAFVDFGGRQSGFLHITDLHPKYFPGRERKERVGKKIPRRERPPIQDALKRGDEVLVQVLKEGIGTKGPTLTSYLSIPGRLIVMMPDMDRIGVSRKVEDDDERRAMRKVLDTLDLPKGFGFILRTAGMGRNKTELKRDVAYLQRLWKVMEKRIARVGAPCELYTESDLLIRTVRDVMRPSIQAAIVDSESAYERASEFLRVAAPRSAPKVIRYAEQLPIFHAFDIERQIELIHNREVPLASGGAIIIEQTEAMVTIDVNSGRSRSARDSETNAFHTNCEAADEICRQLRLRDLGGLIVNDLIDMRHGRNRRAIEERFRENLKRDRARTTVLRISDFGLVEMTRQRMRPSLRKSHFMDCPHCLGHGELKMPETVASDAMRHLGYLLQYDRVARVELVCSPRVASVLLSTKRRALVRLEDLTGKKVDVRVSEAIAVDHVDTYAYDERNADIDISKLPALSRPTIEGLENKQKAAEESAAQSDQDESTAEATGQKGGGKKKRRRRRKPIAADAAAIALSGGFEVDEEAGSQKEPSAASEPKSDAEQRDGEPGQRKRRRRRRRGGRGRRGGRDKQSQADDASSSDGQQGAESGSSDVAADSTIEVITPVRIHQLARELDVPSREIVNKCHEVPDIEVKNHMSSVSPHEADVIRSWFSDSGNGDKAATDGSSEPARDTDGGASGETASSGQQPRKKKSRRSRRRRSTDQTADDSQDSRSSADDSTPTTPSGSDSGDEADSKPSKKRRGTSSGKRRGRKSGQSKTNETEPATPTDSDSPSSSDKGSDDAGEGSQSGSPANTPRRRTLYRTRRKPSPTAVAQAEMTEDQ